MTRILTDTRKRDEHSQLPPLVRSQILDRQERELERRMVNRIREVILELGYGFSFTG